MRKSPRTTTWNDVLRVQAARHEHPDLNQYEIAILLDLTPSVVSRILRGCYQKGLDGTAVFREAVPRFKKLSYQREPAPALAADLRAQQHVIVNRYEPAGRVDDWTPPPPSSWAPSLRAGVMVGLAVSVAAVGVAAWRALI